ncbi:MAG: LysM domain-containing protein [Polyangiaceae bacterium]
MHAVGRLASVVALILSTAVPGASAQRIHTVVNGQTLGAIAKRYGISVAELREANQLPKGVVLKQGQRFSYRVRAKWNGCIAMRRRTRHRAPVPTVLTSSPRMR